MSTFSRRLSMWQCSQFGGPSRNVTTKRLILQCIGHGQRHKVTWGAKYPGSHTICVCDKVLTVRGSTLQHGQHGEFVSMRACALFFLWP